MGIALAKSQSARELSHQLAFMGSCLTISHTCLPSHVFASFAFLMFTFLGVQKRKWGAVRQKIQKLISGGRLLLGTGEYFWL